MARNLRIVEARGVPARRAPPLKFARKAAKPRDFSDFSERIALSGRFHYLRRLQRQLDTIVGERSRSFVPLSFNLAQSPL